MLVRFRPTEALGAEFPDLIIGKDYTVLGIEYDDYRIVNEYGRPYLYPPGLFTIVDASHPEWIENWDDGYRTAYPEELNGVGFFEDLLEGDPQARAVFEEYLKRV